MRSGSTESILHNHELLQKALYKIQQGHDEYAAKANGMLTRMELFDIYFGFHLALLVFLSDEQFSKNVQAKILPSRKQHTNQLYIFHILTL